MTLGAATVGISDVERATSVFKATWMNYEKENAGANLPAALSDVQVVDTAAISATGSVSGSSGQKEFLGWMATIAAAVGASVQLRRK